MYYLHDGPRVILLLRGGDKVSQQRDIERAYQLAEDCWSGGCTSATSASRS